MRGQDFELERRLGRHRRDHVVHEHVESGGDARRRPARAQSRRARASRRKPWVKTSLGPGSLVVTDYLEESRRARRPREARLLSSSATAARPASATPARCRRRSRKGIAEGDLVVASVLSGNRNFEGRVHPEVKMNYLASPPLVVAYALAGTVDIDLTTRAARHRQRRQAGLPAATSGRPTRRSAT